VGFVNFPTHLPSTKEGGMFVRLVVEDVDDFDMRWPPCCGGYCGFTFDENYIADDWRARPRWPDRKNFETIEEFMAADAAYCAARDQYDEYHFPLRYSENQEDQDRKYESIGYLAVVLLGATGWSSADNWICTQDDLTAEGLAFYKLVEQLYPGRRISLQTWLDT
jgi:hypothetical protein